MRELVQAVVLLVAERIRGVVDALPEHKVLGQHLADLGVAPHIAVQALAGKLVHLLDIHQQPPALLAGVAAGLDKGVREVCMLRRSWEGGWWTKTR